MHQRWWVLWVSALLGVFSLTANAAPHNKEIKDKNCRKLHRAEVPEELNKKGTLANIKIESLLQKRLLKTLGKSAAEEEVINEAKVLTEVMEKAMFHHKLASIQIEGTPKKDTDMPTPQALNSAGFVFPESGDGS